MIYRDEWSDFIGFAGIMDGVIALGLVDNEFWCTGFVLVNYSFWKVDVYVGNSCFCEWRLGLVKNCRILRSCLEVLFL